MPWFPAANPPSQSTGRNALWLLVTSREVIEGGYSGDRFITQSGDALGNVSHWARIGRSGQPPVPYPTPTSEDRRPRRQSFLSFD
ncbi:MAG TPA: hypothetical protein VIM61_14560 [Chthoniobacterales bacterium]|jgi:hypothetical protein